MSDPRAQQAIDFINDKIAEHEREIVQLKTAANSLAAVAGLPAPHADVGGATTGTGGRLAIRPDQFTAAAAPSVAARAYLELRGKERGAASADEIFDALMTGGYPFEQKDDRDAKSGLRIALGKDRQITALRNGFYGLAAWYPNLKREARGKPGAEAPPAAIDGDDSSETEPQ
jgi:hypothetical protein